MTGEIVLTGPLRTLLDILLALVVAVGPAQYVIHRWRRAGDAAPSTNDKSLILFAICLLCLPASWHVLQRVGDVAVIEWAADGRWRLENRLGLTIGTFRAGAERRIYTHIDLTEGGPRSLGRVTSRLVIVLPTGRRVEGPGDRAAEVLDLARHQGVLMP